jgi:hypothetical protein
MYSTQFRNEAGKLSPVYKALDDARTSILFSKAPLDLKNRKIAEIDQAIFNLKQFEAAMLNIVTTADIKRVEGNVRWMIRDVAISKEMGKQFIYDCEQKYTNEFLNKA